MARYTNDTAAGTAHDVCGNLMRKMLGSERGSHSQLPTLLDAQRSRKDLTREKIHFRSGRHRHDHALHWTQVASFHIRVVAAPT